MRELIKGIWQNFDEKFDLQLDQSRIREQKLAELLAGLDLSTIELKSESFIWENSRNLAVEYERDGRPSGIAVTQAATWGTELWDFRDGQTCGYFLVPMPRMKALCRRAFREGRFRRNRGDQDKTSMVLLPISWLLNVKVPVDPPQEEPQEELPDWLK